MPTERLTLLFPPALIKEPLIYKVSTQFRWIPNIRKARVTESKGELVLDVTGTAEDLAQGIAYLEGLGVKVHRQSRKAGTKEP